MNPTNVFKIVMIVIAIVKSIVELINMSKRRTSSTGA